MGRCAKAPATHIAGIQLPNEIRLLSRKQAADYFGTGLDVFIGEDAPPAFWIGPKTCRYVISDLLAWAKRRNGSAPVEGG